MSMKEAQEQIVKNMRKWQKIENAGISSTGRIIEKTENPIVRLVMEIIQRDSQMHHRVQEMIAESLESKAIALSTDELGTVWEMIEEHIKLEKATIELAKTSLQAIKKSKGMLVQAYLLEYLLKDEQKHDEILANLEKIKKNMYPYA
jgi:rubrerythrin